jgi:hypothetical protein
MRGACLLALGLLLAAATAGAQSYGRETPWSGDDNMSEASTLPSGNVQGARPLRIRTLKPACFVAAGFPVVRALIDTFVAVLPKPRPSAQSIHYFVEATAPGHPQARGQQHVVPVVEEAAQCTGAPGETAETAAVAVRVPKGAPMVPPVPPGFVPVGAVNIDKPRGSKSALPLIIVGGLAGVAGAMFALPNPDASQAVATEPTDEINFLDSDPPPDSRFSLRALPPITVRMRVRSQRAIGPGNMRVILFRSFSGAGAQTPCGVLLGPHGGFPAGEAREIQISGPLQNPMVCQPADRMRLAVEENDVVVLSTGPSKSPDYPTRFFIDP